MNRLHPELNALNPRASSAEGTPYIIAETACAHDGDAETLRRLVHRIARERPDAIQVEVFSPEHQVSPRHESFETIERLALAQETWEDIIDDMRDLDPAVFVFAYDRPSLAFALEQDVDGIKLSSADLANPEMIELAADAGLPTTLSTGGCSLSEIARTVDMYTSIDGTGPILMHGVQNFPTPIEQSWIHRVKLLEDVFGLPVGYQDHTEGESELSRVIDLLAIGVGAMVLEKHVTLSRADTDTDFESALEPQEFATYINTVRDASGALGSRRLRVDSESEREYQRFQKKAIVTVEKIETGERITRDKVEFLRNDSVEGMSPWEFESIEGCPAAKDLAAFQTVTPSDLKSK